MEKANSIYEELKTVADKYEGHPNALVTGVDVPAMTKDAYEIIAELLQIIVEQNYLADTERST